MQSQSYAFRLKLGASFAIEETSAIHGRENAMSEVSGKDSEVTWQMALQVWWALTWRIMALGGIVGALETILLGKLISKETDSIIFLLSSIPSMVWAVRSSLSVNYRSFKITINRR
jgi:hypothetical protein